MFINILTLKLLLLDTQTLKLNQFNVCAGLPINILSR
jgi:hypothetical protein